ncbi:hypothetical protein [Chitinophaga defluvii]|uniref:Uncharacterized protein n=1 Tax=Chitinophaga defluvii TaxID=3163343 RepID=A0ABV2T8R5_9BACT
MNNRDLPRIDVKGDIFIVDLEAGGLRNTEYPFNTLRFADMIDQQGAIVKFEEIGEIPLKRFFYDSTKKEIAPPPIGCEKLPTGVSYMEVFTEVFLDPVGQLLMGGADISDLPQKHLKSWFHLAHEIPHINIYENDFLVDTARQEIYHVSDFTNKIDFGNVASIKSLDVMCFTIDGNVRLVDKPIKEAVEDNLLIITPMLDKLDPIGFQRATGVPAGILKRSEMPEKSSRIVHSAVNGHGRKI